MYILNKRRAGTPSLRRPNLLGYSELVVRVKLRLETEMVTEIMCWSVRRRRSLQVRPRCHSIVGCFEIDKHCTALLFSLLLFLIFCHSRHFDVNFSSKHYCALQITLLWKEKKVAINNRLHYNSLLDEGNFVFPNLIAERNYSVKVNSYSLYIFICLKIT